MGIKVCRTIILENGCKVLIIKIFENEHKSLVDKNFGQHRMVIVVRKDEAKPKRLQG
jgi:hypothetical protein